MESQDKDAINIAVLSEQITGLKELMTEKLESQNTVLAGIKEQTSKTNGHVAQAFTDINKLNEWKNKLVGGLIVSNALLVPVVIWLVVHQLSKGQ